MNKSPVLGTVGRDVVPIDVSKLLVSKMLLTASSGGGKSWALRRLLEQTFGHAQHLVLDPDGEFHTLREKLPYVLVGEGGEAAAIVGPDDDDDEIDARATYPGLLAHRLLTLGTSAIIDLSDLRSKRDLFVRRFVESMMLAPRELWHGVLVVLDEAHKFAPERGAGEAESTEAVKDLATDGRKRGFCLVAATQRVAELHKTVVAQCQNRLVGMTTMDLDVDRARRVIGMKSAHADEVLKGLEPGQFFAVGPALSRQVVRVDIGAVATTHPGPGAAALPPTPTPEEVRKVLGSLKDLPKEAVKEAKTVATLRARVRELESQIAGRPSVAKEVRVEVPVIDAATFAALLASTKELGQARQALASDIDRLERFAKQLAPSPATIEQSWSKGDPLHHAFVSHPPVRGVHRADTPTLKERTQRKVAVIAGKHQITVPADSKAAETLPRASVDSEDIINGIAAIGAVGLPITIAALAAWLNVHPRSSSFLKRLGQVRADGLVDGLELTGNGRALVDASKTPTVAGAGLTLRRPLSESQARIVDTIASFTDRVVTSQVLAAWVGVHPRSSSFLKDIGWLRERGYLNGNELTVIGSFAAQSRRLDNLEVLEQLDDSQRRIIETTRKFGAFNSATELATELGVHPRSSSFLGDIGKLRERGFVTKGWPLNLTDVFVGGGW